MLSVPRFKSAVLTVVGSTLGACAATPEPCCCAPRATSSASNTPVALEATSALPSAFNDQSDRWRIVSLVSPTCSECVLGAEAVKREVADRYGADRVAVLTIWTPMLETDTASEASTVAGMFPADRARQFYDGDQAVGWGYARSTFAGFVERAAKSLPRGHVLEGAFAQSTERPQWDLYMLYAPGIRWESNDRPPVPSHWIRHCGRVSGPSIYWLDSAESGPREGDLFEAVRSMVESAVGKGVTAQAVARIEVLGFADCPHTMPLHQNVVQAVKALGLRSQVVYVDQEALTPSDLRRGWPAPTVLVDGGDLFGMTPPTRAVMSCRAYPGGLPSAAEVSQALQERPVRP